MKPTIPDRYSATGPRRRCHPINVVLTNDFEPGVVQAFLAVRNDVTRGASAAGLTEGLLTDLLSDDETFDPRQTSKSTR